VRGNADPAIRWIRASLRRATTSPFAMKSSIYVLALLAVGLSSCDNKKTSSSLDAEQLAYSLGGQQYFIQIPADFDAQNDLLGLSLEFGDGTRESLGGIGYPNPGDEVRAVCLPNGEHSWLFSVFSDKFRGRIPIALPSQYRSHVVSTFINTTPHLSIGDPMIEFSSDRKAENGIFPQGEKIRIILTIHPKTTQSEQIGKGKS